MTELEFEFLRSFLKQRSGLALTPEKRYLVESRLTPVCRRFGLASLGDLIGALKLAQNGTIERAVVEAMTTNETFFFRDRIPFDLFRDTLLPDVLARNASRRRLRIWCAAASTGQEPYSLAMLLQEAAPRLAGWQVEIVATDLSTEVIEKAKLGLYSHFEVQRGLPVQWLIKYFTQVGEQWQIAQSLRSMVDYRQLNLLHSFASLGQFDVIYCRTAASTAIPRPRRARPRRRRCAWPRASESSDRGSRSRPGSGPSLHPAPRRGSRRFRKRGLKTRVGNLHTDPPPGESGSSVTRAPS
jgi:chemotaxis protein methyltransferase CheR